MTALVISAGPVNSPGCSKTHGCPATGDIGEVAWQSPVDILTIQGNGSSYFSGLASQWAGADGHILPNLLAHYGRNVGMYDAIGVTGFSAGHGLWGPLLLADGDSVNAAVLFDSCFTGKGPASHPSNGKDGYAAFGARAVRGEKLMVLTSSHGANGPGLVPTATGSECALASFQRAIDAAGGSDAPFDVPPGVITHAAKNFYGPGSLETHRAGNFFVLDYGPLFYHGDHINLLSRDILSAFMAPYLATRDVPGLSGSGDAGSGATSSSNDVPIILGLGAVILAGLYYART